MPGLYFEECTVRRKWFRVLICTSAFLALTPTESFACSCPMVLVTSVREGLQQSAVVFMGKVNKRERLPQRHNGKVVPGWYVEDVTFKVTKVWKGVKPGQTVRTHSAIGPGPCGISVYNDPPFIYELDPQTHKPRPEAISDEWLVYGYGNEPYELSRCSRSAPVNLAPARDDMSLLNKLISRNPSN